MADSGSNVDYKTMTPQPRPYLNFVKPPYSVEASGYSKVEGETIPRRHPTCKDKLQMTPEDGIETIFDIIKHSSEKYGNAKALGSRKVIDIIHETKTLKKKDGSEEQKKWSYFQLSPYTYMSFTEYEQLTMKIGSGYRSLGMKAGDRVHIFAATGPKWLASAHGAVTQSMPIVTAYDTLGEEGLKHSLLQTHATAMFCDGTLLTKLINPLKEAKDIKNIIYNTEVPDFKSEDVKKLQDAHPHLTIIEFDEFVKKGEQNNAEPVPPKPDDLCCIMYTSGSTGAPKGVLLKHRNVVAAIAGVHAIVGPYISPRDGLLAYLPLAHIFEFVFENACLYWGGVMGYGNPKTISDASVRNCAGDIREFKPTILIGVPAVWETVKKGVLAKVDKSGMVAKHMFWAAYAAKNALTGSGLPLTSLGTSVVDSVVFSKVKEATGGRLRICLNGGGPVAKDTQRFISMVIAPMLGGYGLTETAAMGAFMDPLAWSDDALGTIPASVEVKLVDFPDAGYYAINSPPQGEIWIRGGSITGGYLDLPEETKESFTDDGWFKTGDIGEFNSDGHLRIIDRKKNLVKTQNGEYIALEKLESIYRSASIVANICVYAAQDKSKPVAIIIPVEAALKKLAGQNGINDDDLRDLCQNKKVNDIVLKELQSSGKKGGLAGIEIIEGVVLTDEEWTPQNGLLTSAQKLNRKGILNKLQKQVDQAYA